LRHPFFRQPEGYRDRARKIIRIELDAERLGARGIKIDFIALAPGCALIVSIAP